MDIAQEYLLRANLEELNSEDLKSLLFYTETEIEKRAEAKAKQQANVIFLKTRKQIIKD